MLASPSIWNQLQDLATNDCWQIIASGAPTNGGGGTGAGLTGPGSMYVNTATGDRYININTKASPTWVKVVLPSSAILSTSPSGGVGYATGAGGAITQITSRATGVTINTPVGAITLFSAAGSATPASFVVTNSMVAATDVIILNQKSGTDKYELFVTNITAGNFTITFFTTGGTTTEQPVFNFAVIKGVAS